MCEFCHYTDYDSDFKDYRPHEGKDDSITLAYSEVTGFHYLVNNLGNEEQDGESDSFRVLYCPFCGRKLTRWQMNEEDGMIDLIVCRVRQMLTNKGYSRVNVGNPRIFLYSKDGYDCEVRPDYKDNCITLHVSNYGLGLCVGLDGLTKEELEAKFSEFIERFA